MAAPQHPSDGERTALYRLYDASDQLLYVGIATDPKARWYRHASDKDWWGDVATREVEWFASREEASNAEITAIHKEKPTHNRTHNYTPSPLLSLLPLAADQPMRPRLKRIEKDERSAAQRVAADLRALIMSGDVPLASKLPTTSEFMAQYRISNVTVQRALAILKDEGFAIGRSGAGVYITSPTPEGMPDLDTYGVREIESGIVAATVEVATQLDLSAGQPVFRQMQVTEADGWPLRLTATYRLSPEETTGAVEHLDSLTVRLPTSAELVALHLPEGIPVLRTLRTTKGGDGKPLEVQLLTEPGHLCRRQYRSTVE